MPQEGSSKKRTMISWAIAVRIERLGRSLKGVEVVRTGQIPSFVFVFDEKWKLTPSGGRNGSRSCRTLRKTEETRQKRRGRVLGLLGWQGRRRTQVGEERVEVARLERKGGRGEHAARDGDARWMKGCGFSVVDLSITCAGAWTSPGRCLAACPQ